MTETPDDRALPGALREAIQSLVHTAQMFGSASGREAPIEECRVRMKALQTKRDELATAIVGALSQHYNAGIELGRAEGLAGQGKEAP